MKLPYNVDFNGKVVVVTGAGGVLCGTMARAFAQAGAKVAALDRNEDAVKKLIEKIEELKAAVGEKKTIAEYGVDEKYFLDTLDNMVEQAFDDQCTGANPRYPLMSEIREMYLRAYYGK